MQPQDFAQSLHVANIAGFAAFSRALLDSTCADSPDVVGLAVRLTLDGAAVVIEAEYLDAQGRAIGGFGL